MPPPFIAAARPVVLVVEDDSLILLHARLALEDAGFRVLAADDGDSALACLAEGAAIAALFTDIDIPGAVDGLALAERVHATRPEIAIFVTSGSRKPVPHALPGNSRFVPKPYTAAQMCRLLAAA